MNTEEIARARVKEAENEAHTALDLRDLGLRELPPAVERLRTLRTFDVSGNRLRILPDWLWRLPELEELDVGDNRLIHLQSSLEFAQALRLLDVSENRLSELPEQIGALRNLERLYLYGNRINVIPKSLANLPELVTLDLASNRLASIPALPLRLQTLDLSGNEIQGSPEINGGCLRVLDLSRNRIRGLPSNVAALEQVEEMYLDGNELQERPPQLSRLGKLRTFSHIANPFSGRTQATEQFAREMDRRISGGPVENQHYFENPPYVFEFFLAIGGLAGVLQMIDLCYKRLKDTASVVVRYPDGGEVELRRLPRKTMIRLAEEHASALRSGSALLDLGRAANTEALQQKREFALAAATRIPQVALVPKAGTAARIESGGPSIRHALSPDHIDTLVNILAVAASSALQGTPQDYFRNLVSAAHLPEVWTHAIAGRWSGNAEYDARFLIDWAVFKKINSEDSRYTALGSLLRAFLHQRPSPDDARAVIAILIAYNLILDGSALDDILVRFSVPVAPHPGIARASQHGPEIQWLGPPSDVELQSFLRPEPSWQDVGFLRQAIARSSSVCRVETGAVTGTGFLIAPTLALTNYHVLCPGPGAGIETALARTALRFGSFTASDGEPSRGRVIAPVRVIAQSPVAELDFVLLEVERIIQAEEAIEPAPLSLALPAANSALNILHHPGGDAMKLSASSNGVTGVYEDRGYIQYVTNAGEGSSGSPCFNDDWEVVALHHAQRARSFGSVREGILIRSIYQRIQKHL